MNWFPAILCIKTHALSLTSFIIIYYGTLSFTIYKTGSIVHGKIVFQVQYYIKSSTFAADSIGTPHSITRYSTIGMHPLTTALWRGCKPACVYRRLVLLYTSHPPYLWCSESTLLAVSGGTLYSSTSAFTICICPADAAMWIAWFPSCWE